MSLGLWDVVRGLLIAVAVRLVYCVFGLMLNTRIYRHSNIVEKRRWLVRYACLALDCDSPILEALFHAQSETPFQRDQTLLEKCYLHLLANDYSIIGKQWPDARDDRLLVRFELDGQWIELGYARTDKVCLFQLQTQERSDVRILIPRDGATLAFLYPKLCCQLQAITQRLVCN